MVLIHDVLDDIEADASAGLVALSLEEWFEDTVLVFCLNADAVVAHLNAEVLAVRLHDTTQPHIVLGIFIGIGQQVTDHLDDSLLVDDGGEPFVRVGDSELLAALLKCGCKAFTHGAYQFMDVLWGEVHHQHQLLHFTEVEQLIDEFQQTVRITVNHLNGSEK